MWRTGLCLVVAVQLALLLLHAPPCQAASCDRTSCEQCTASSSCGWCADDKRCLLGNATQPTQPVPCKKWRYGATDCAKSCSKYSGTSGSACAACINAGDGEQSCTWCSTTGTCSISSPSSPCGNHAVEDAAQCDVATGFFRETWHIVLVGVGGFLVVVGAVIAAVLGVRWWRRRKEQKRALGSFNEIYYSFDAGMD